MEYILPQKSNLKQIQISEINSNLPDLKSRSVPKATAIANWLTNCIENNGDIKQKNIFSIFFFKFRTIRRMDTVPPDTVCPH